MSFQEFDSQEDDYHKWLRLNPNGFVLSTYRSNSTKYMSLHRANCRAISVATIRMKDSPFTGRDYIKICSTRISELEAWAKTKGLDAFSTICKRCSPIVGSHNDLVDLDSYEAEFVRLTKRSLADTSLKRMARLNDAPKFPQKRLARTEIFLRNPDVVAEVLHRASGVCGHCRQAAPFMRKKDGKPYLEVHHMIQLALGGEDTVANAIAVCANCHRNFHFGPAAGSS